MGTIEPDYFKYLLREERLFTGTTKFAQFMSLITGVGSPAKWDFFIKEQFGSLAAMTQKLGDEATRRDYFANKAGLVGEYYFGSGRLFTQFYDSKAIVDNQYERARKNPDSVSPDEFVRIKEDNRAYEKAADMFSALRKAERAEIEIPEKVKRAVFNMLIALDLHEPEKALDSYYSVLDEIAGIKEKLKD